MSYTEDFHSKASAIELVTLRKNTIKLRTRLIEALRRLEIILIAIRADVHA